MTVLLTGATGLVGARLLPRLLAEGVECRALVRGDNPLPEAAIAVHGDLLEADTLASAVRDVSAIIHLAATFRTADSDLIWRSNLEGSRNLIAAARTHAPQARFIMASTGLIYDDDATHPGREDDPRPRASTIRQETRSRERTPCERAELVNTAVRLRLWRPRRAPGILASACRRQVPSSSTHEHDPSPRHRDCHHPRPRRHIRRADRQHRR